MDSDRRMAGQRCSQPGTQARAFCRPTQRSARNIPWPSASERDATSLSIPLRGMAFAATGANKAGGTGERVSASCAPKPARRRTSRTPRSFGAGVAAPSQVRARPHPLPAASNAHQRVCCRRLLLGRSDSAAQAHALQGWHDRRRPAHPPPPRLGRRVGRAAGHLELEPVRPAVAQRVGRLSRRCRRGVGCLRLSRLSAAAAALARFSVLYPW